MWTVVAILVVLWLVGFLGFPTLGGGFIHILLVIAVIVLIVKLIQGRRAV
jgi:tryptophan-rich sensory protein